MAREFAATKFGCQLRGHTFMARNRQTDKPALFRNPCAMIATAAEQADEATRVAANWIRDEKLETMIPNAPKITDGKVTVHKMNGVAAQL